jgi:hypothetical protein
MRLGLEISFDEFLIELQIDEFIFLFALHCTLRTSTFKKKHKPWDIHTNVFNIQVRSLWEANANAQFILDPYVVAIYCTSYLTKVDKFVTCEMQYILNKNLNKLKHLNE